MDAMLPGASSALELIHRPWIRVAAGVLAFTALDQLLASWLVDTYVPRSWVKARARGKWHELQIRRANNMTRAVLSLASAFYFLVATLGHWRWLHPLYSNHETLIGDPLAPYVNVYFQLLVARVIFESLVTVDAGLITIMTGIVRGMHTFIPILLVWIAQARGGAGSIVHLSLIAQFDLVQALVDLRGTGRAPFLRWRLISFLWFVLRIALPAYALYQGYFGRLAGRGAYATIVFFQFVLWVALPTDPRRHVEDE